MSYETLVKAFADEKNNQLFTDGAETLKKEMIENDYKVSVRGAELFLDNCGDSLGTEVTNFYRLCVIKNINLFEI